VKTLSVNPGTVTRWLRNLKRTKNGLKLVKAEQFDRTHANRFQLMNRADPSEPYRNRKEVLAGRRYIAVPNDIL